MMTLPMQLQRTFRFVSLLLPLVLQGCAIGYYWQAGTGHLRIINGQQPVAEVLQRPQLQPLVRERLEISQQALQFAHTTLRLPDNGSYTDYYDTGAPYVVWNVVAAPELSLEPRTWCFLIAGCIAYRGYYSASAAQGYAATLDARGDDVFVGGVAAYSTLGRFRDPLLNTMLRRPESDFVALLFHELAHQLLYVQDDSAFNESFATVVEQEGLRRWQLAHAQLPDATDEDQQAAVLRLLRTAREELRAIYASGRDIAAKRTAKQQTLAELERAYANLSDEWRAAGLQSRPYAQFFSAGMNNATLVAVGTYDDYVPAFQQVLRECGAWLACFYHRSGQLAAFPRAERTIRLQQLRVRAGVKK